MEEVNGFSGLRNDVALERFKLGDLASAVNVELDETGKIQRRLGTSVVQSGQFHSVWADAHDAYVVKDGSLQRVNADLTLSAIGVPVDGRVSYQRITDEVYWSDGVAAGVLAGASNRKWGIEPPPAVTVGVVPGDMQRGMYLVTMTYVRADGRESGAAPLSGATLLDNNGLSLALPVSSDPQVAEKRVYVSEPNGGVAYLAATLPNSDASCVIVALPANRSVPVRTLRMGPPPAGDLVGYYNGRAYVGKNNYLWYSQPYEYELFHRAEGFLGFASPVRIFAPVSDGIFVGSDEEIVFLHGGDPTQFVRRPLASYGAIKGTLTYVDGHLFGDGNSQSLVPLWMTKRGVMAGFDGGAFKNLTGGRYILPDGVSQGASLIKVRGGTPQLVTSLFN